jgi:hypothetical protein
MSQGLEIRKVRTGWKVVQASSGLPVIAYGLRLRRQAMEFRDELYATGADFTAPGMPGGIAGMKVGRLARKWHNRTLWTQKGTGCPPDPKTGEWYSQ